MIEINEFEELDFKCLGYHKFYNKINDKYEYDGSVFERWDCGFFKSLSIGFSVSNYLIGFAGRGLRFFYEPNTNLMYCRYGLADGLPIFFTKIKTIKQFKNELKKFKINI